MKAVFQKVSHEVIFTEHSILQMRLRNLTEEQVIEVIETGELKSKGSKNKFWVFKNLKGRTDNLISVSISIEKPHLIVITTMISWRPE
jgi:hypothetical protein